MGIEHLLAPAVVRCEQLSELVRLNLPECKIGWEHYASSWAFKVDGKRVPGANSKLSKVDFQRVVRLYATGLKKWRRAKRKPK